MIPLILTEHRVYSLPDTEKHSKVLEYYGIPDYYGRGTPKFFKVNMVSWGNKNSTSESDWDYEIGQDIFPEWYVAEYDRARAFEHLFKRLVMCKKITVGKLKEILAETDDDVEIDLKIFVADYAWKGVYWGHKASERELKLELCTDGGYLG